MSRPTFPANIALTAEARTALKSIVSMLAPSLFKSNSRMPTYSDAILEAERIIRGSVEADRQSSHSSTVHDDMVPRYGR